MITCIFFISETSFSPIIFTFPPPFVTINHKAKDLSENFSEERRRLWNFTIFPFLHWPGKSRKKERNFYWGSIKYRKGTGDSGGVSGKCSAYHSHETAITCILPVRNRHIIIGDWTGRYIIRRIPGTRKVNLYTFQKMEWCWTAPEMQYLP